MTRSGAGSDVVGLDSFQVVRPVTINTGAGDAGLVLETRPNTGVSDVNAPFTVEMGAGNDTVILGGGTSDKRVIFSGASLIDGGGDIDTLHYLTNGNILTVPPAIAGFEMKD